MTFMKKKKKKTLERWILVLLNMAATAIAFVIKTKNIQLWSYFTTHKIDHICNF